MKKIVLLTFCDSNNFGAGLQALATYRILTDKGNSVQFLNYRNAHEAKYEKTFGFMRGASFINNFKMIIKKTVFMGSLNGKIGFYKFNKLLPKTKKYSQKTLSFFDNENTADLVVIGSDQVWNPLITGGIMDLTFWGNFTNKPIISFSSSAGSYVYNDSDYEKIIPLLSRFKMITVREEFLKNQLAAKNINSTVIPDPTLLLGSEKWKEISERYSEAAIPDKPYAFLYLVGTKYADCSQYIEFIKKKLELEIVYLDKYNLKRGNIEHHYKKASPFDWVKLLMNSSYVLTDSFHGTAFSLMFHKNLSILKTGNPMRIQNLLELVGIEDKMFSSMEELKNLYSNEIDYASVDKKLKYNRDNSYRVIDDALLQ